MAIKPVEILIKARDEASSIFGSLQGKLIGLAAAVASLFGVALFASAVRGASELEAKLSEVKAVSGATADEMVLLKKAAEDAGSSTKFTATEAAEALGNLSRAGLSAKDSIAALPAVLSLAQAGGIGLGDASQYITKATMGMGLAFADAGRVADVLAAGANASNTSVTGLAQALSYAAPTANSLGLSLETTVAIIGKFADAGIDASRAGTALNAIMGQFSDPASKFRQELGAAGITTGNFEQALRELAAAGPRGQKAINAVGLEAGPALKALLNQGIGALDELKGKLDNAAGSAAKTAATMEDNLPGAMRSLGSAWDTVKNVLGTPVLPVLKDGVDQLSGALRGLVTDGTIGKFGESMAEAFRAGIKWGRDFMAQIDFAAITASMQAFAVRSGEVFTKIGEYASTAGNTVKLVYGVMSAGTNAVLTAVYGIGIAFSEVAIGIVKVSLSMTEALQKIAFGSAKQRLLDEAAMMRTALAGLTGVSEEFGKKANSAFVSVADGAETARNGFVGLANGTASAATEAGTSAAVFKSVATDLTAVGAAAETTGEKAKASGDAQKAAADVAKKAIEDLRKKAEEDAAAIAAAFTRMGIKTQAELKTVADTAAQDWERIKASGLATTDGLATAFKAYAEAAIAANGGVASETLKAQAAMYDLEVTTDRAGKSIVKAMDDGRASTDRYTGSVHSATAATGEQIKALERLQQLTSDGLKVNKDGSAAGTFGNMLPTDLASKLKFAIDSGQTTSMTQAELDAAKKQATDALAYLQQMSKLSAGSVSTRALQDAQALVNATNTARVNITDKPATDKATATAPAKTYTVNINLPGSSPTAINTSSDADAQKLIDVLQRAKLSA